MDSAHLVLLQQPQMRWQRRANSLVTAALAAPTSAFDIPAAPILIPEGPWKEVEGSVNAAKGFKAQGQALSFPSFSLCCFSCNGFAVTCTCWAHTLLLDIPEGLK